jgi:hypothetical protein
MALQQHMDEQLQIRDLALRLYRASDRIDTGPGSNKTVIDIIEVEWLNIEHWGKTIADWFKQENEKFEWALRHSNRPIEIISSIDAAELVKKYALIAYLSDRSLTEWVLRFK